MNMYCNMLERMIVHMVSCPDSYKGAWDGLGILWDPGRIAECKLVHGPVLLVTTL